jgi:PTH1 family peptidyl-tRNA hydrolase
MDPADYVLGRFKKGEEALLEDCLDRATEAARLACELGAVKAMNQINRRQKAAGASAADGTEKDEG